MRHAGPGTRPAGPCPDGAVTMRTWQHSDPESDRSRGRVRGVHGVYAGLPDLGRKHPDPSTVERLRYTVALIDIQKRLRRNHPVASCLRAELVHLQDESLARDPVSPEAVAAFARVYTTTVSTLTPKIMIRGNQQHLRDDDIVLKVRAVLLAGVRAAYLFHEHGGRKWQLFIGRRTLAEAANRLLETL